MEEHIFGTYATDELKVSHHRAIRRGVQHWHDNEPRQPQSGQPVTVKVRVGPAQDVQAGAVIFTTDGSIPAGSKGQASNGSAVPLRRLEVMWDNIVWGYVEVWGADLPAQPLNTTVRYRISVWDEDTGEVFANWPDAQLTVEAAAAAFFKGEAAPTLEPGDPHSGAVFTYHAHDDGPPDWAYDAVIYQIFPDRFYPGDGRDWQQTEDVAQVCGGTLRGITDKLDYVADMGFNAIWMTPIFPAPTHHGYDATDYRSIEPRLGTDADLHDLVRAAHERGIRVILDLVCNHISHQHPVFQAAVADEASPYRDWFTFNDSAIGYRSFFGVQQMPQLNLQNAAARAWMIGHAEYWLREFNVDGYRLDYALGPGPDFWADFTKACKAINPACFIFGEIVDSPSAVRRYIGRLDGNLDFHIETALRKTYAYGDWTEDDLWRFVKHHYAYFGTGFLQPTFLDNHDTDRFLAAAGGDKDALKRAATTQMKLAPPPIVYYGTEVGLSQRQTKQAVGLDASREVMPWGEDQDAELREFYRALIRERKKNCIK